MHMPLRCLTFSLFFMVLMLPSIHTLAGPPDLPPLQEETATSTPVSAPPSPADVISAVNNLRLLNGLNALTVHDVLMAVAAEQANALAASQGAVGHNRPCGMTLGQELLQKGFPLWGDLSQDGYRSENWGTAMTAEEAISMWLGDDLHANTMLSPNRSDIGAAVAVSDQIYIVLETALSTNSGQMQYTAHAILTGIPITQAACMGWTTQSAEYGNLSQYSVPVVLSTARPDGDVIHEVKYGQTLWSIAIQYGTTIEQIKRWNNLDSDIIAPGWVLLIQKGATQPAPSTLTPSTFEPVKEDLYTPTLPSTSTPASTEIARSMEAGQVLKQNSLVVVALVISLSVLIAALVGFRKK
ncbi:MAG TPA: LysM peptidoglycan-binding domain-containing protein [Anaerolineales bacterium]|nr:LysM peptidoglycan-binding domain-containing protein [Anaerolineales bacterium]